MSQLTGTRTVQEMRLEHISKSVREVEHKSHEDLKETGDAVSGQSQSRRTLQSMFGTQTQLATWFQQTASSDLTSEIQEQRLANVSRLITLGSEANPHPREQGGVRH